MLTLRRLFPDCLPILLLAGSPISGLSNYLAIRLSDYLSVQVQVQVTLRLTVSQSVSQSVSLGVEPRLRPMTRCLLLLNVTVLFFVGRPLGEYSTSFSKCLSYRLEDTVFNSSLLRNELSVITELLYSVSFPSLLLNRQSVVTICRCGNSTISIVAVAWRWT
jgi:hypothetical protein